MRAIRNKSAERLFKTQELRCSKKLYSSVRLGACVVGPCEANPLVCCVKDRVEALHEHVAADEIES